VVNRMHVALPKPRDATSRPPMVPPSVAAARARSDASTTSTSAPAASRTEKDIQVPPPPEPSRYPPPLSPLNAAVNSPPQLLALPELACLACIVSLCVASPFTLAASPTIIAPPHSRAEVPATF